MATAGCNVLGGDDGRIGGPGSFSLTNLVFAAEQPAGYDEYTEQPDASYDVEFDLTDDISGATTSASGTFTLRKGEVITDEEFSLGEFAFCSEPPAGHDDFAEQREATYTQGDAIWMYADFTGENYEATQLGQRVAVDSYLKIVNPSGVTTFEDTGEYADVFGEDGSAESFFVKEDVVAASDAQTGEYSVSFEFTDTLTEAEVAVDDGFTLESG
jgi:hypothetical protein